MKTSRRERRGTKGSEEAGEAGKPERGWKLNKRRQRKTLRDKSQMFLGSTISQDLKWESNIDAMPSGRRPSRGCTSCANSGSSTCLKELLIQFYTAIIIKSVLCTSITVWFGSATKQTGQEQTTATDSQDCRENHQCQPALHSGLCPESGNGQDELIHVPLHVVFAKQHKTGSP
ncbi:hypothetical protein L3Q82_008298 [Scortum barcoo]|uniref:Uncharacterized protein n=1 Tax=Scortum barcoo TaxID=214431 RepID=A0ACB8WHN8_9TELE|nr:hypothetical protein L3Q82_008298 [Scortum barcoo]